MGSGTMKFTISFEVPTPQGPPDQEALPDAPTLTSSPGHPHHGSIQVSNAPFTTSTIIVIGNVANFGMMTARAWVTLTQCLLRHFQES